MFNYFWKDMMFQGYVTDSIAGSVLRERSKGGGKVRFGKVRTVAATICSDDILVRNGLSSMFDEMDDFHRIKRIYENYSIGNDILPVTKVDAPSVVYAGRVRNTNITGVDFCGVGIISGDISLPKWSHEVQWGGVSDSISAIRHCQSIVVFAAMAKSQDYIKSIIGDIIQRIEGVLADSDVVGGEEEKHNNSDGQEVVGAGIEKGSYSWEERCSYLSIVGEQLLFFVDDKGNIKDAHGDWERLKAAALDADDGVPHNLLISSIHPQYRKPFLDKLSVVFQNISEEGVLVRLRCQVAVRGNVADSALTADEDETYSWYEMQILPRRVKHSPKKGKKGNLMPLPAEAVIVMRCIDREISNELMLRNAKIEAELAQKGRYEFLGHMSHELRTPLNAMMGFAEAMEFGLHGEIDNPKYREYLANIRESGQLLLHRVDDMIDVVSLGVEDNEMQERHIHIRELMEDTRNLLCQEAFCRDITVLLPEKMPKLVVYGDKAKLVRALGNILSNAIRFSEIGSEVRLMCGLCCHDGEDMLRLLVVDKGVGMSESHVNKLRASLSRAGALFSQNPEAVGIGLGLTVAKEYADLHGGDIEIFSVKNEGTSASLLIPLDRVTSLDTPRRRNRRSIVSEEEIG